LDISTTFIQKYKSFLKLLVEITEQGKVFDCRRGESTHAMGRLKIGVRCTLEDPGEGKD
jgi:hypothetical protein